MSVLFESTCGDSGLALADEWDLVAANISILTGGGYQGTNGIESSIAPYSTPWLCKTISPSPADTITLRWLQWIPAMPLTGFVTYVVAGFYYNNGGAFAFANRQLSLNTTNDGKFYVRRGSFDTGTTIAGPTTNPVWVANTWQEIEMTVVISDTVGEITIKKDGTTVLTATGLDTQALGTAAIDGIEIIPQSASGSAAAIDGVVVSDTGTPASIVGSAVFGVNTTVTNTRAIAFGLDNNVNKLTEAGKFKVFGKGEYTDTLTVITPVNGTDAVNKTYCDGNAGGAPSTAQYVTLATDGTLTAERVLTAGTGISLTDGGAGSTITIATVGGAGGSGNVVNTGALGSEPGTPATGDLYLPNNGFYLERYSGSAWAPWGPIYPMTPPVSGDFSWDNQGSTTIDTTNGGIYISTPAASGSHLNVRYKTAPSTPYTVTIALLPFMSNSNTMAVGLAFRQSSDGKIVNLYLNNSQNTGVEKWTNSSSFSAAYTVTGTIQPMRQGLSWMRIADNGTNRICSLSHDGQHWVDIHTVGRTDFLTADQVGFFVTGVNATTTFFAAMTLLSWKEA